MRGSIRFSLRLTSVCYGGGGGRVVGGHRRVGGEHVEGRRYYRSSSNIVHCDLPDVSLNNQHLSDYLWSDTSAIDSRIALVNGITGAAFTYKETKALSRSFGSALAKLGCLKGDVMAVILPNCVEYIPIITGTAALGAVTTTINAASTSGEIARQLKNSQTKFIVTYSAVLDKVKEAVSDLDVIVIVLDKEEVSLQKMLKDPGDQYPLTPVFTDDNDVVMLPYSSGTTGVPKGVMLTHRNIVTNLKQIIAPGVDFMPQDPILVNVLPMYHASGSAFSMTCLALGGKVVALPSFDPATFLKAIVDHRPNFLPLVPPLVSFLANHPAVTPDHLSSVKSILVGAAPLGTAIMEKLRDKAPQIKFQEVYGMTELSPAVTIVRGDRIVEGSVGQVIPSTKMKVVDLGTGESVGPGETGELCFQGPQVMAGYLNNPTATDETIVEGWLHTGDIGHYDQQENVFIVDRVKELIKVKGLQVAPAELEDTIRRIPNVKDVAVIGIEDERAGEVPRAFVVRGDETLDEDTIKEFVASQLSTYKHLEGGVEFVPEILKSAAGKILRKDIKAAYKAKKT